MSSLFHFDIYRKQSNVQLQTHFAIGCFFFGSMCIVRTQNGTLANNNDA